MTRARRAVDAGEDAVHPRISDLGFLFWQALAVLGLLIVLTFFQPLLLMMWIFVPTFVVTAVDEWKRAARRRAQAAREHARARRALMD